MPCCGEKRQQQAQVLTSNRQNLQPSTSSSSGFKPSSSHHVPNLTTTLMVEYLGLGRLAVVGPASGRQYIFDTPGARVAVDARDQHWLSSLPRLRLVTLGRGR